MKKQKLHWKDIKEKVDLLRDSLKMNKYARKRYARTSKLYENLEGIDLSPLIRHMKQKKEPNDEIEAIERLSNFLKITTSVVDEGNVLNYYGQKINKYSRMKGKVGKKEKRKSVKETENAKVNKLEETNKSTTKTEVPIAGRSDNVTETNEEWEKSKQMLNTMMDKLLSGMKETSAKRRSETPKKIAKEKVEPLKKHLSKEITKKVVTNPPNPRSIKLTDKPAPIKTTKPFKIPPTSKPVIPTNSKTSKITKKEVTSDSATLRKVSTDKIAPVKTAASVNQKSEALNNMSKVAKEHSSTLKNVTERVVTKISTNKRAATVKELASAKEKSPLKKRSKYSNKKKDKSVIV
ncbi:hypothetical protein WDU94_010830 [Cyamophila willieti]